MLLKTQITLISTCIEMCDISIDISHISIHVDISVICVLRSICAGFYNNNNTN